MVWVLLRVISGCVVQHAAWSEELEVDQDTHRSVWCEYS